MTSETQPSIARSTAATRFITVAFALSVTMAGATLASPLYPLYEQALGISSGGVTIAYSSYMAGALLSLLLLSHLSDHVGFIHTLRISVLLLIAGLCASAAAHSLQLLVLGRFAIGISAGIASSAATAGLIALEPVDKVKRAQLVGSIMNIVGLGFGPFAGGVVAQVLPHPLLTPYLMFGIMAAIALLALALHPADGDVSPIRHFRPALRLHVPHASVLGPFVLASLTTFSGYTLFSLFASLAPALVGGVLPWHGPAIAGAVVATLFIGSAVAQFALRGMNARRGLAFGAVATGISVALIATSLPLHAGMLFIASDLIGGFGQGLAFMSALSIVNSITPPEHRARSIASFFSIAYLGGIVPVVGLGLLANRFGLDLAVAGLAALLSMFTFALGTHAYRSSAIREPC